MEEIWKDVKGFESLYMVSNLGRVKNVPHYVTRKYYRPSTGDNIEDKLYIKEVLLNPKKKYHHKDREIYNYFYYRVSLRKDGKYYNKSIHRLVAEAFLPNPDNLPCVNHKDENKLNNCVDNLEWCTKSYNHSYGTCIERTSEKQRLTHSNCITIVGYKENEIIEFHSISSASRYFNVSHAAISKAIRRGNKCKGYNWKYKI